MKSSVHVVMGNDFPAAVFSTAKLADDYVKALQAEEPSRKPYMSPRVYWRVYEFEVDK
jgi:hypothetical protein